MNYYINRILQEKSITSYLESRGIFPQKRTGDKDIYHCPIHQGDNDPSFVVYPVGTKGRDYQTYYCFGCHSGITLINLKSALENISIKEVVKYFIKDIKIDTRDVVLSIIEDAKKQKLGIEENKGIEFLLLMINSSCRRHIMEDCEANEEEIDFFENFFKKIDDIARARNLELLQQVSFILDEGKDKRSKDYKKKKEEMEISSLTWKI